MWAAINTILNLAFDVFLWPFQWMPWWAQVILLGIPAAAFGLLVFKWTSNQDAIQAAKDKIWAHLLELLLYKDDFGVSMRAQWSILKHNVKYVSLAIVPMLVMIGPFILGIVQVETRFAFDGFEQGKTAVLRVELESDPPASTREAKLEVPKGVRQDTPPVRLDDEGQIFWRLGLLEAGVHDVGVVVDGASTTKRVLVNGEDGKRLGRPSVLTYRSSDFRVLGYPAEPALPSGGPVKSIEVVHPPARAFFAGLSSASWLFCLAALAFGFVLKGPLGVTF